MKMRQRVVALAAVALLPIAGCATDVSTSTSTATVTAEPTSEQGSSSETPTSPADRHIDGTDLKGTVHVLDTVYSCTLRNEGVAFHVFDPARGTFVDFTDRLPVPPGSSMVQSRCTLTGTPADLKAMYLWEYSTPAAGLSPATTTRLGVVRGIHDATAPAPVDITTAITRFGNMFSTDGGPVMSRPGYNCDGSPQCTVAFRPGSLNINWADPRGVDYSDAEVVVFQSESHVDTLAHARGAVEKTRSVAFRDVRTGTETTFPSLRVVQSGSTPNGVTTHGFMLEGPGAGFFNSVTKRLIPYPKEALSYYTNSFQGDRVVSWVTGDHQSLTVMNVSSGTVDFHLNEADMSTLKATRISVFDNYLYVTNDNDSPVLDLRTRKRVNVGWKTQPIQWINSRWLLVSHTANTAQHCYELGAFECDDETTLEYYADGKYTGERY